MRHDGVDMVTRHRLHRDRPAGHGGRRAAGQAAVAGAGRQGTGARVRGRGYRRRWRAPWPWAAPTTAGQDCTAATRVYVERSRYAEVVDALRAADGGHPGGRPARRGHGHRAAHLRGAPRRRPRIRDTGGAPVAPRCSRAASSLDGPGAYYPPTLVVGAAQDSEIVQGEVFGPVLVVVPVDVGGRDGPARQRHALRPRVLRVDLGCRARPARQPRARGRRHVGQRPPAHRLGGAPRRGQGQRLRQGHEPGGGAGVLGDAAHHDPPRTHRPSTRASAPPEQDRYPRRVPETVVDLPELVHDGVLDAELAALCWLMVEGGVPFVVTGDVEVSERLLVADVLIHLPPPAPALIIDLDAGQPSVPALASFMRAGMRLAAVAAAPGLRELLESATGPTTGLPEDAVRRLGLVLVVGAAPSVTPGPITGSCPRARRSLPSAAGAGRGRACPAQATGRAGHLGSRERLRSTTSRGASRASSRIESTAARRASRSSRRAGQRRSPAWRPVPQGQPSTRCWPPSRPGSPRHPGPRRCRHRCSPRSPIRTSTDRPGSGPERLVHRRSLLIGRSARDPWKVPRSRHRRSPAVVA